MVVRHFFSLLCQMLSSVDDGRRRIKSQSWRRVSSFCIFHLIDVFKNLSLLYIHARGQRSDGVDLWRQGQQKVNEPPVAAKEAAE